MAQSKHDIQALLAQAGVEPRHRFGQNFLIDLNLLRLVAEAGRIEPQDLVIEVGPGTGSLTEELLERGAVVVAVEIDRALAALLRQEFAPQPRFRLIEGDALAGKHALNPQLLEVIEEARARHPRPPLKLVANLPYNIASPLIVELLLAGVELLAFTVQKEVANRLRAATDGPDYGPITVMVQLLGHVELLRTMPPQAFWPSPKVDSALVRIQRDDRLGSSARPFSQFVQQLFAARRKMLRNALARSGYAVELLQRCGLDAEARVETVTPQKLLDLFRLALPDHSGFK